MAAARRLGLFGKLYLSYVALILVSSGLSGVLTVRQFASDAEAEVRENLRTRAELLRDDARAQLARSDHAVFQERLARLGREIGSRLTVIDARGRVVADSAREGSELNDHSTRPEIVAARRTGTGFAHRFSESVGKTFHYVAIRLGEENRPVGFVRVSLESEVAERRIASVRLSVFVTAIVAAAVAIGLGWFVARRVTSPLRTMTDAADSIARGERWDRRLPVGGRDEIGTLAQAFNEMADELERRFETITRDRNKLRTILSGLIEGVVAIDPQERIVHMNGAAARLTDVGGRETVGKPVWEVVRTPGVCETLKQALDEGGDVRSEIDLVGPGGADRQALLHATALRDGRGEIAGAVLLIQDVTEFRRLEAIRRDFVANVSHELKTPITAIRGFIETLLDDPEMGDETRRRFQEKIRDQSLRLSALVSDLLTLARVETREGLREMAPLDLRSAVHGTVRELAAMAESANVAVEETIPAEPVTVLGDEGALRQLVRNLLDNALKYTPAGGRVRVTLRPEGDRAVVEVADTGIGIDPKHAERIFERFYRVDKARSRGLGGTGLGLSIVKHLAQAHGGTAEVESTPGRGSTFRVRLPQYQAR